MDTYEEGELLIEGDPTDRHWFYKFRPTSFMTDSLNELNVEAIPKGISGLENYVLLPERQNLKNGRMSLLA